MIRVTKVLELLESKNLDAIYLTNEQNVNYISGFTDEAANVLICKNGNFLITDGRFTELAEKTCPGFEIVNWHLFDRDVTKAVKHICTENGVKNLGFEEVTLSFNKYNSLHTLLEKEGIDLAPTQGIVESLRYVKDEEEILNLRKACEIADKALEQLVPHIKAGVSERELCAHLEFYLKINGAHAIGFETILISGVKTSLPHGKPDDKIVEEGDFVTIDFGAMYNGYISDMTRTFVVGKPNDKQIEVYNLVKKAQQVGLDHMKNGAHATEPDTAIRKVIKKYEEFYYNGIGHGVGRNLHEEPFIGNYGSRILESGCVITMEPGLYIPGWGGVRIEDSVLIKDDGIEILTKFPKDLIIIEN
ncbi:Xaa-Pro peptidase family protein [Metaclostridioides mangenotii]|uniref:M24 family metallopeptidase n=1 Tax=Metaclostridioides mangenotii TaxID=1540 RepID=UPI0028EA010F|nr:Xaa-Pro peptidase family protein [Clostridioides mangenotii]